MTRAADDARWLASLEGRASERLPPPVFEYVAQGAREGRSAARAVGSWAEVPLYPHVLRDVTDVRLGVELLGTPLDVPWGVAPTTLQRAVHPDGELAVARATAAVGGLMVVSSNAGTPFADIGATGVTWWLQAYVPADRALAGPLLDSAVAAGAAAVVLTVDTPVVATKHIADRSVWDVVDPALVRVNFGAGYDARPGSEKAMDLGPDDLDWLARRTGLPVVVKGVLRGDDAQRCVDAGAQGIWVSNHGGRQLDRAADTAAALAGVRAAVGHRAQVYVDGGVRSGADVVTALALGADGVFLGRLPLYALVGGRPDVVRMNAVLRDQTLEAMRLAGCRTVADTRDLTAPEPSHPL
ncbi:alpha-hydroxy acid oxidase [Nocardioides sp. cx-173]|uniref:alpha-hydroxy acid oxidase n=1 Tax=Nocardioides sp. cx-173 TaxID=2898796 RepID=UPI001E2F6CDE|nr:alpha-hydroxy acid oxidase [Nocardioides sp. cx-173]MCD4527468.1 alpha-hydroxy-acid oxidizing protein [Nocardioides sp. cx-173]UGB40392.1 alpha-hydroxy-acid oxidizing protein [Nocardioides sp. cx-173]